MHLIAVCKSCWMLWHKTAGYVEHHIHAYHLLALKSSFPFCVSRVYVVAMIFLFHLVSFFPSCQILSPSVKSCSIDSHLVISCSFLSHLVPFCHILSHSVKSCSICSNLVTSFHISSHLVPSCPILSHLLSSCHILSHVLSSSQIFFRSDLLSHLAGGTLPKYIELHPLNIARF